MYMRHFLFAFLASTTLVSQLGYIASQMKPVLISLSTSSAITFWYSGTKLLFFCFIGWKVRSTLKWWVITSGSMLGIYATIQANRSRFFYKSVVSRSLITRYMVDPIFIIWWRFSFLRGAFTRSSDDWACSLARSSWMSKPIRSSDWDATSYSPLAA